MLLCVSAFLRSLSIGATGVLLGIYLTRLGLPPAEIGFVVSAGLGGAALATLLVTIDCRCVRKRRRFSLVVFASLGGAGGLIAAFAST